MKQTFKNIKDYHNLYQVGDQGMVKSLPRKINTGRGEGHHYWTKEGELKTHPNNRSGYYFCTLQKKGTKVKSFYIHRLVAEAFIPNPDNLPNVKHKDGDKSNNCVDNLLWATQAECNVPQENKVYQYDMNTMELIDTYPNVRRATKHNTDWTEMGIGAVARGERRYFDGYYWSYRELTEEEKPTINDGFYKVYQYDLDLNFVDRHFMIKEAAALMGDEAYATRITTVAKGHRNNFNGYYWSYKRLSDTEKEEVRRSWVKVYQYEKDSLELVRTYTQIKETKEYGFSPGIVGRCLCSKENEHRGYLFTKVPLHIE